MISNDRMSTTKLLYPERRPTLRQKEFGGVPADSSFFTTCSISQGARNHCPFFHGDDAARIRAGEQEIGLTRQKRRHLQNIRNRGDFRHIFFPVNVGQYWTSDFVLHAPENVQALRDSRTPVGFNRAPVGLVIETP